MNAAEKLRKKTARKTTASAGWPEVLRPSRPPTKPSAAPESAVSSTPKNKFIAPHTEGGSSKAVESAPALKPRISRASVERIPVSALRSREASAIKGARVLGLRGTVIRQDSYMNVVAKNMMGTTKGIEKNENNDGGDFMTSALLM